MAISASKILVPIDFSEQSMIALGQAFSLAKIKKSDVVLLSVIQDLTIMQSLFMDNKSHEFQKKLNDKLINLASEYQDKYNVEVDTMVAKGKVYEQINNVAEMISADLIIMGTNGSPKTAIRKFIGSNAERVVRSAYCPVITIKGKEHRAGCKNIILPLDLEKETKEKVTTAIEYARYWNATIRVVSVILNKNNDEIRKRLIRNIEQVSSFIQKTGVKCTSELLDGDEKQTLGSFVLDYEKNFEADLIIIMTKKEELSLSNNISVTARYIINNSSIPVMSIRPKERKYITPRSTTF
jgi:nucleotide-binding universal stress UspA family protein